MADRSGLESGQQELRTTSPYGASHWHPRAFGETPARSVLPTITSRDVMPILAGMDLWDCWPLQHEDGRTVEDHGHQWWFFLSSPRFDDPVKRHGAARIRLVSRSAEGWSDHGCPLDPSLSPGSREWAGSAVLMDDGRNVALFFTAAGRPAMPDSVEQRIFAAYGKMSDNGPERFGAPQELIVADGRRYVIANESKGQPGLIKGFRDPSWFRDPATGTAHLVFTASAGWVDHDYNGVIGLATRSSAGTWQLSDPLVSAVGVNNELERPHIIVREGTYYLFWSTQRRTFDPAAAAGPNGLYAMAAAGLGGPWRPVNGTGLVAANPEAEPTQGYSWWVTGEGVVWSFIDYWGMAGRRLDEHPQLLRSQFGGTPAPQFALAFDGPEVLISR